MPSISLCAHKRRVFDELSALDDDEVEIEQEDDGLNESMQFLSASRKRRRIAKESAIGNKNKPNAAQLGQPILISNIRRTVSLPEPHSTEETFKPAPETFRRKEPREVQQGVTVVKNTPVQPIHRLRPIPSSHSFSIVKDTPTRTDADVNLGGTLVHDEDIVTKETPTSSVPKWNPPRLVQSVSAPVLSASTPTSSIPMMKGKRNKGKEEKIVKQPEARQVFKGMYFYFYPNNTINEVRRVRIIKAIEFGAEWVKDWQEGITHVVVSKGHTYPHLLKFLKMPSLPIDIVVVNDDFIPGCIEYRGLMSMETLKDIHQVEGHKTNMAPPDIPSSSPDTRRSLQIKPSKKQMQPSQTPSVTEQSSLEVAHALRAADERSLAQLPTGAADPLFELMKEAKELQELPIDTEDEDSNAAISPIEDDSDESSPKKGSKASASRDGNSWQDNFQCMHKNTGMGGSDNPNARTIQVLQQMCEYYNKMQDQWRTIAYRKAIASLRKETKKISTRKEARNLPYVGERLAAKIEEIFFTDRLRRLDNAQQEPTDAVLQMFMKIYGVGFSQASKWVNQGYRSLEDLSARAKLTENQRIGIRHFEDFNSRIPRKEVEQHGKIVRETLQAMDPAFEITIMGSYRRGMKDSGDIDLIITKKNASLQDIRSIVITTLVPKLSAFGFLKAGLATMYNDSGSKWHGASVLPGSKVWRRIDLLLVPWNEIGAAMLYFTGNDIFNRSIRLLASKKGMRLNQRGLYKDVSRGQNRQKLTEGTLVESRSERKIFQILGVPWRDPVHRIC